MGRWYGLDLRQGVIEAIDGGMSARAAARRFAVAPSTAIRWHAQWRSRGSVAPAPQGQPRGSRLDAHESFLVGLIEARKDIALHEMVAALEAERGLRVGRTTLWKFLNRRGWTFKKRLRTRANSSARTFSAGAKPGSTRNRIWTRSG